MEKEAQMEWNMKQIAKRKKKTFSGSFHIWIDPEKC